MTDCLVIGGGHIACVCVVLGVLGAGNHRQAEVLRERITTRTRQIPDTEDDPEWEII